jgi:membrane-anchored mycosin MYCP
VALPEDPWPRRAALGAASICLTLLALVLAVSIPFRRDQRRRLVLPGDEP